MIKPDDVINVLGGALYRLAWDTQSFPDHVMTAMDLGGEYAGQDALEPDDLFTEAQLVAWALDHGMVYEEDDALPDVPVIRATRYDNQVDEIRESTCPDCGENYQIVEVFVSSVDVECACGPSEFDLVPENEMAAEAVRY